MPPDAVPLLAELSVVDLCVNRAGSVAGMLLADLGAVVHRVESTHGAHRRASPTEEPDAVCWDRGKHTVVVGSLDPQQDRELSVLLDRADIVLLDGTPASCDESGLTPQLLGAGRPRLCVVWLPPYGANGDSYRDLPHDPLLLAAITGYAMHQPAIDPDVPIAPVVPVVEYIQGSLGASAAVAGVLERERSGVGQIATVSGVDAVGALLATLVNDALDVEQVFRPNRNPEVGPSFRSYRCGDGEMLFLATLIAPLFLKALDVLDAFEVMLIDGVDGEFLHLFRPEQGRQASRLLEAKFAGQPRQHWLDRFEAAGVPAEAVQSREDWLASPQFAAAAGRYGFEHPVAGAVETPRHPVRLSPRGSAAGSSGRAPVCWPARADGRSRPGPLAGLRVIDLANFLAGPFAPTLLAFWGADVVKIEPTDGDPYRVYTLSYLAVNQGKGSAVLDVRTVAGKSAFSELVASADVLVDNLRPSTRHALGLDDGALERMNPDLVHARVTAFGDVGGFAERPGFDPSIQALSGMMVATGGPDTPLNTTTPVHDVASGASLALGILAALWHRTRTGEALKVSGSLAASSALLQCAELTTFEGRAEPPHGGVDFLGPSAARRFYRARDGWVAVAARDDREVVDVLTALDADVPSTIDDDPHGATATAIAAAIGKCTVDAVLAALRAGGVPATAVVGADWATDPYLEVNEFAHIAIDPAWGRCRVMRGAGAWSRSGTAVATHMHEQGSDTEGLLAEGWTAPH